MTQPNAAAFIASLTATSLIDTAERAQIEANALRIFDRIPEGLEAITVRDGGAPPLIEEGEVVVYQHLDYIESFEEGGFYVLESQRTPACMPEAMWAANYPDPMRRSALITNRYVRRIARSTKDQDLWYTHPLIPMSKAWTLESGEPLRLSDGPWPMWALAGQVVGRVVGIYNPAAFKTGGHA